MKTVTKAMPFPCLESEGGKEWVLLSALVPAVEQLSNSCQANKQGAEHREHMI